MRPLPFGLMDLQRSFAIETSRNHGYTAVASTFLTSASTAYLSRNRYSLLKLHLILNGIPNYCDISTDKLCDQSG
jgi:hypothetical protein